MKQNSKKWKRWLTWILSIYLLGGVGLYYLQDILLFHPVKLGQYHAYAFTEAHREINIPISQQATMNVVCFTSTAAVTKGVVLYFHGNKNNIGWYARYAPYFTKHGYELWMMDYPGFGKSTGSLDEQTLYSWALQLYKMARSRYAADSIIIYGKSMGTGIAAQLASVRDCKRLILETPYYSLSSLAQHYFFIYPVRWMLHYKMPTGNYLQKVTAPVTIFHGTADRLIPWSNAARLKARLKPGDAFISIDGGGHNNLFDFSQTTTRLDSLLSQ
ncbi:MAG TPA: alpha/beta fold hydrolase [Chitinophagaceae bacterium]|nr:alpha/beta fold hydrolase [Chitinophagaceae bacterium]